MKKIITMLLSAVLLLALTAPALAADGAPTEKEEVLYGILGLDGSVKSLYAVNIFNTGDVTDYGDYSRVENLTNSDPITQSGDEITIRSSAGRLYYQGTLKNLKLPWDIAVTYTLDGRQVPASQLAGASGALAIRIRVTQDPDVDSLFFDNYALQIALSLDTERCTDIVADGATVADAGTDKQLSYIVLPGKGADLTVCANIRNFAMDAMTFNGVKLALNMDIDDTQFNAKIDKLTGSIASLDSGAGDLLDGASRLKDGMSQYLSSLSTYKNGIGSLKDGASKLASGLSALEEGFGALTAQNDSLNTGAQSVEQAAFDAANAQLAGAGLPTLTPDNYADILSGSADLAAVKTQLDGIVAFAKGVGAYTAGVSKLQSGVSDLSGGASQLSSSLSQVASGAQGLYDGAAGLNSGIKSLKEGLAEYKSGTGKLHDGTADMGSEVSDQISALLSEISGGTEVRSFVSAKDTQVTSVQFVLKTDAVEAPEKQSAPCTQEPAAATFWDRLLALFGV